MQKSSSEVITRFPPRLLLFSVVKAIQSSSSSRREERKIEKLSSLEKMHESMNVIYSQETARPEALSLLPLC
ncbi:hypothetical protein AXF42_Ash012262 [Apostasia shenzhenica]|uniref:Uncharacterized protein n=1 Tax=Apostasia shenzhenica TaxID=1088818 RepID=A0A2I0B4E7_9ASPA|nr:hypothetical protein AXF42_Ash012262 [Apostasia shenzhenica]